MRCIHTISSLATTHGGPSYAVSDWADALTRMQVDCNVIYLQREAERSVVTPALARSVAVKAISLLGFAIPTAQFSKAVKAELERGGPAVLHDHGLWNASNYVAASAAISAGARLIVSPHGTLEPWALAYHKWKKDIALFAFQRRLLRAASLICVTTVEEAESVRRFGARNPLAIVPIGTHLPPTTARHEALRSARTLLFVSRVHPKKGLLLLVRSLARVRPKGWKLVVVGPDENGHRAEIENEIRRLDIVDLVEFRGELRGAEKAQAYCAADFFVLPTHSENFGMVVPEALAHGLPVLTTTGTPWSMLPQERAGWWVAPTSEGLEQGPRLATSATADERAAMGARGRALVARLFAWPAVAQQTLETYRWVTGEADRQPAHVHLA